MTFAYALAIRRLKMLIKIGFLVVGIFIGFVGMGFLSGQAYEKGYKDGGRK